MDDSALPKPPISLLRYICSSGLKRQAALQSLSESKVCVNGEVTRCGSCLVYHEDAVTVDGHNIAAFDASSAVVVAFNKPCGLEVGAPHKLCTKNASTCTFEALLTKLASDLHVPRLFAIGRLDKHTSGLLLLTNDGELSQASRTPGLLSKTYIVVSRLRRVVNDGESFAQVAETEEARARLYCRRLSSSPIQLSDGPVEFSEADCMSITVRNQRVSGLHLSGRHKKHCHEDAGSAACYGDLLVCTLQVLVKVTLKIGRNRVVRRAVAAAGLPVCDLHRCMIGPIQSVDLDPNHHLARIDGSLPFSVANGGHVLLSRDDVTQLWQSIFGERGRHCMADMRVKLLRRMCQPQGSRESDSRLLAWLRCHEHKFAACLGTASDEGDSSDDQD